MVDGPVAIAAKVAETAEELRGAAHAMPGDGLTEAQYVLANDERPRSPILMIGSQTGTRCAVCEERESTRASNGCWWWWAEVWKSYPHLSKVGR